MKKCPRCNAELADDAKFCASCGTALDNVIYCAQCGQPLVGNTTFCVHCGAKVKPSGGGMFSRHRMWFFGLALIATAVVTALGVKMLYSESVSRPSDSDSQQLAQVLQADQQSADTTHAAEPIPQAPTSQMEQPQPARSQDVQPQPSATVERTYAEPENSVRSSDYTPAPSSGATRPSTVSSSEASTYTPAPPSHPEEVDLDRGVYVVTRNMFVRTGPGSSYEAKESPYNDIKSNYTNGVVVSKGSRVMVMSQVINDFVRVRQLSPENDRDEWIEGWVGVKFLTPEY